MNIPNKRFLTFISIGIFSTLFDAGIFTYIISIFGRDIWEKIAIAKIISLSIVVSCSFILNGKLTFRDNDLTLNKLVKYYGSASIGMFFNIIIVIILMTMVGFGTIISTIIAACVIVFFNYTMSNKFIFKGNL